MEFVFPNTPAAWMTLLGLLITVILFVRKVPAALLISIVITSVLAFVSASRRPPRAASS